MENFRTPLTFTNPLYNKQQQYIDSDLSDDDDQTDSSKALHFINSLCLESFKDSSNHQSFQQQQPLFVLNNCYISKSTQNLASSNIDTTSNSNNYCLKTNEELNNTPRRQPVSSSQQLPPKMGVKALNHTFINKVRSMKVILSWIESSSSSSKKKILYKLLNPGE
jgi:hypothetical protein